MTRNYAYFFLNPIIKNYWQSKNSFLVKLSQYLGILGTKCTCFRVIFDQLGLLESGNLPLRREGGGSEPFFSLLIYDYHSKELCTPFYGNEKFAFVFVWQHIQNHDSFIIQCNILRLTANYGKLRKKVFFLLLLQFFEQLNEFLTCYTYKLSKKRNGGEILNFWFFGRWGVKTPFFGQIRIQPYPI